MQSARINALRFARNLMWTSPNALQEVNALQNPNRVLKARYAFQ